VIRYGHAPEPNAGNEAAPGVSNVVMSGPSVRGRKTLTTHPNEKTDQL
jgi:hypothetical protein